ncbi:MAG: hypothetical protein ACPGXK_15775 [Phycisphaerae bacterium]
MNRQSVAAQLRLERELQNQLVRITKMVLVWKAGFSNIARKLSTLRLVVDLLHRHVIRLTALHPADGYMAYIDRERPELSERSQVLGRKQRDFRDELSTLVLRLERLSAEVPSDVDRLCLSLETLLESYEAQSREETELLQDAELVQA